MANEPAKIEAYFWYPNCELVLWNKGHASRWIVRVASKLLLLPRQTQRLAAACWLEHPH